MNLKFLFCTIVGICIANEVSATFRLSGNNDEVDVCTTCNKPIVSVPRPHPRSSIRIPPVPLIKTICRQEMIQGPKPFEPIGDICNCGKQIVKPAPLPNIQRHTCLRHLPKINIGQPCSCAQCGNPVRAPEEYQIVNSRGAEVYLEKSVKKVAPIIKTSSKKADAVSVAIARQLANQAKNSVSEKHLQYGSLKEPKISEKTDNRIRNNHIREESFYETNGDVLEINAHLFNRKPVSSEESSEEEEPKPKVIESFNPSHLKYDDIGYGVYEPSNKPRYVVVKNSEKANHNCPHSSRRQNRRPCGCHRDLVVDQSEISEQSVSYENNSENSLFQRSRLST